MCTAYSVFASDLSIPNVFVANTPAVASEVNGNFGAVEMAVDDNNSRIAALEATVVNLQNAINSLNSRLTSVENNTVLELDGLLGYSEFNGYPTAEFRAVNLQINNGLSSTFSTPNGLGNIIIGFNETSAIAPEFCSNPIYTDSVNCIGNGFLWERNVRRGSHNLVLGINNSYSNYGSYIGGFRNIVNAPYASVFAGFENEASGQNATISGGARNYANATRAHISGGWIIALLQEIRMLVEALIIPLMVIIRMLVEVLIIPLVVIIPVLVEVLIIPLVVIIPVLVEVIQEVLLVKMTG